jgi:hypothetical protein
MNLGDSDARLLASLAITATESMNSVVFGEENQGLSHAIQLAKDWSSGEKDIDFDKLYEQWRELGKEAFSLSSSLRSPEGKHTNTNDPKIQATYVTGSLMLYILYLEPTYRGIHPTKPPWHARVGANLLASIITSDAAKVMSRTDNTRNHQQDINIQVRNGLSNR